MKKTILILSCATTLTGCGKKDLQYHDVDSQLKAALNLKTGSYFVYKNTLTSVEDSFWVTDFNDKYGEPNEETPDVYEYMNCTIKNAAGNRMYTYTEANSSYPRAELTIGEVSNISNPTSLLTEIPFIENDLMWQLVSDRKWYTQRGGFYPVLKVAGKDYTDVAEVTSYVVMNADSDTIQYLQTYFSHTSGIIKFTYRQQGDQAPFAQGTWELQRSKIER